MQRRNKKIRKNPFYSSLIALWFFYLFFFFVKIKRINCMFHAYWRKYLTDAYRKRFFLSFFFLLLLVQRIQQIEVRWIGINKQTKASSWNVWCFGAAKFKQWYDYRKISRFMWCFFSLIHSDIPHSLLESNNQQFYKKNCENKKNRNKNCRNGTKIDHYRKKWQKQLKNNKNDKSDLTGWVKKNAEFVDAISLMHAKQEKIRAKNDVSQQCTITRSCWSRFMIPFVHFRRIFRNNAEKNTNSKKAKLHCVFEFDDNTYSELPHKIYNES